MLKFLIGLGLYLYLLIGYVAGMASYEIYEKYWSPVGYRPWVFKILWPMEGVNLGEGFGTFGFGKLLDSSPFIARWFRYCGKGHQNFNEKHLYATLMSLFWSIKIAWNLLLLLFFLIIYINRKIIDLAITGILLVSQIPVSLMLFPAVLFFYKKHNTAKQ